MRGKFYRSALSGLISVVLADAATPAGFLKTDGTRIVNEHGQPVVLRGVNLGGWLVEEMWMMPFVTTPPTNTAFAEIRDHVTLWKTLEQRFGLAEMQRLRDELRHAWLGAEDVANIRAAGLNCVRLPFLYDLTRESGGLWPWLDDALAWARENELYVVLDMHGAPGRQSKDHHSGEAGRNQFFFQPELLKQTAELWRQIALRYRDHTEVAGYDLLNEPMGAPDNQTLYQTQDVLFRAIRAVDTQHILFVEDGYKGASHMPTPAAMGWTNVAYSIHSYRGNAKSEQDQWKHLKSLISTITQQQQRLGAPFYVGEFNIEPHGTPALLGNFARELEKHNISWSLWTYKTVMKHGSGTRSLWGWYRTPRGVPILDPFRDSAAEWQKKIQNLRTANLVEYTAMTTAFRAAP